MNAKKTVCGACLALWTVLFCAGTLHAQASSPDVATALRQAAEQFAESIGGGKVAVLGVASGTADLDEYLLDELSTDLMMTRAVQVAPQSEVDAARRAAGADGAASPDADAVRQIGEQTGADTVVYGTFKQLGAAYTLNIQAVAAGDGAVRDVYRTSVSEDDTLAALLGKDARAASGGNGSYVRKETGRWPGLRGTVGFGLGSQGSGVVIKQGKSISFGGAAFINFPLGGSGIGLQPEVNLLYNRMGGKYSGGTDVTASYLSLDIPLLATYNIRVKDMQFIPEAGPYLSFPLGKLKMKNDGESYDASVKTHLIFGMAFGVAWTKALGPGSLLVDLRYLSDITTLGVKYNDTYANETKRGSLNLSTGYQIEF